MIFEIPITPRPPGFVHVDLDGLWTLADCYGFDRGLSFERDPIYEKALPRLLDLFDRLGIKATFFLIGMDLEHPGKREAVTEMVRRGHDVGNHTQYHPMGLEALEAHRIRDEIKSAQAIISDVSGMEPVGFRAPGYAAGPKVLQILSELGFLYDGSFLPTRWGVPLRFMARRIRKRVRDGRLRRGEAGPVGQPSEEGLAGDPIPEAEGQYGPGSGGAWGLAPRFFRCSPEAQPLIRLPLAASPVTRLPLHASLGMLLGRASVVSGLNRLASCGWPVTYLLHGIDLAAPEEIAGFLPPELAESRAFNIPLVEREAFLLEVLGRFSDLTECQLTSCYLEKTGEGFDPNPARVNRRSAHGGEVGGDGIFP